MGLQSVTLAPGLPCANSNPNPPRLSVSMEPSDDDGRLRPRLRPRRTAKRVVAANPPRPPKRSESEEPTRDIEDFAAAEPEAIRASLLRWYDEHRRTLPWRVEENSGGGGEEEEGRAYAVWVSEVMLQQTRVAVVVGYYERWMERWPTIRHLAAASQQEVNEMWAGLGYYRRARFLLEGAKYIVDVEEFPRKASELRKVPGIGDYTAGAIASIAFNEAVPVVDGNVVRVISRLKAISANPKESATVKIFWRLAGQLVDPSRPGDFNQALMELGATLCSKTKPGCAKCPVSTHCRALSLSLESAAIQVTDYPKRVLKAKPRKDFAAICVVQIIQGPDQQETMEENKKSLFLIVKRPEEGLLAGLWEFPSVLLDEERTDVKSRREEMDEYLKKLLGVNVRMTDSIVREDVGECVHVFSHIRLRMYVELMVITTKGYLDQLSNEEQGTPTWKYVDESCIELMGLTSGVRKVYNMVQEFKEKQQLSHPTVPKKIKKT